MDKVITHVQQWQEADLHHSLDINITVNQAIHPIHIRMVTSTLMIHYGMASSVKVPAALVPTLPHGSVYSFLLQLLMQLK